MLKKIYKKEAHTIQLSMAYGKTDNREVWRNTTRASSSASGWKRRKRKTD